jgi:germination protein M
MRPGWRAAALAAALVAILCLPGCAPEEEHEASVGGLASDGTAVPEGAREVRLVFPEESGWLRVEPRSLYLPAEGQQKIRALVDALLEGPLEEGLAAPLPAEVSLADVFIDPRGIAYLDLFSEEHPQPPSSGSRMELLRVYSLVDTVLFNVEGVRGVVLLWNGVQRPTFAGHVDLSRPLSRDPGLIRSSP